MKTHAYLLALLTLAACSKSKKDDRPVPENLIGKDTMALIMAETAIFNAKSQHTDTRKKDFKELIIEEEIMFFDSLGIAQDDFKRSLHYYMDNPKEMEAVYDEAMNLLTTRLAQEGKSPPKDTTKTFINPLMIK